VIESAVPRTPLPDDESAIIGRSIRPIQRMTDDRSRAEIGLYATLHRLGARVHTSAIVRRLLAES
jgi:hypothetical protein